MQTRLQVYKEEVTRFEPIFVEAIVLAEIVVSKDRMC